MENDEFWKAAGKQTNNSNFYYGSKIFFHYCLFLLKNKIVYHEYFPVHPPLSNLQSEMLKLFSADIPEKYLVEIKNMIASFLLDKARDKADVIWDSKYYTNEKLEQILNKK